MGYVRSVCLAVTVLLAAPVQAQQGNSAAPVFSLPPASAPPRSSAGQTNTRQQGPELDVFRAPAISPVAPPAVAPTVTPVPAPTPAPDATPALSPAKRRSPSNSADPARDEDMSPTPTPAPQTAPAAPGPVPAAPVPAAKEPASVITGATPWSWIIGGALAVLALIAGLLLHRRRGENVEAIVDEPSPPEPVADQAPPPASIPPAPTPAPAPDATNRPWLDMQLSVTQARYSLIGVTLAYDLLLHNRGDHPAVDLLVRGIIGNAGDQQQALLQAFFAGTSGLPIHAAVSILPGETCRLSGELRLDPDQIVPVAVGQRSLLIPIIAFDATYRWEAADVEPTGNGRTARAFIIGQEQEPPADRLAPFRLDQGPRQYRRTATRAVVELTPT